MKNIDLKAIQVLMFFSGAFLVVFNSDGTWESANYKTYLGMVLALSGITLHLIVGFIYWLIDKWK